VRQADGDLSPRNREALLKYVEQLKLRSYSSSTIRTYCTEFKALLHLLRSRAVDTLTAEDLWRYFIYCAEKLNLSENSLHSRMNAIKFYYEQVLKQDQLFFNIPRPKKPLLMPRFFSKEEVAAIINAVDNLKHKVMLMLTYSGGLRVSEVVTLKTRSIDSKRMMIYVERAKGKKDRVVPLSPTLLVILREYWRRYKPDFKGYLFPGQNSNEPYSTRSLQLVLQRAKTRAGIIKPGSVHALRHSFATHLLDTGTDVTMIMKLLGHNDLKTTLRYLHVTNRDLLNVVSPLDSLDLK
jgi:integrase/recombinase XerD